VKHYSLNVINTLVDDGFLCMLNFNLLVLFDS